jgi:hypothetical protein
MDGIGTLAAAVATLSLSGVTVWLLVITTKRLVSGGARQAILATRALELQLEPRIIPVNHEPPFGRGGQAVGGASLQASDVAIENAGSGVAELTRVDVVFSVAGRARATFPGVLSSGMWATIRAEVETFARRGEDSTVQISTGASTAASTSATSAGSCR